MSDLKWNAPRVVMACLVGFCAPAAISGTMGVPIDPTHFVATLSAGPAWQSGGETQTLYLAPGIEKTYVANKSSTILVDAEIFTGIQRALNNTFETQFGVALGVNSYGKLNGSIWDDANPQFDNYTYGYKVQHTRLSLKGKLLANIEAVVTPWVSASIGLGFNRATDFTNMPTIFQAVPNANFASSTQTTFTYTLGVGIQHAVNNNWKVGIGYEFGDWGKSQLDRALGQTLGSGLGLNHLYINGVLLNITYVV